jgi:beta-glucanase (GH16 family)
VSVRRLDLRPLPRCCRRCAALALLAPAVTLAACGGGAAPEDEQEVEVATFREPEAGWRVAEHPLGRGVLKYSNVKFGRPGLQLVMPPGTLNGGEVKSIEWRGDGTFTARMKGSGAPGSISAFFLYRHDHATDTSDELDFEIPGGAPPRVLLTVWRRGSSRPADETVIPLDFDPAAGLHEYTLRRDGSTARFSIDGREMWRSDVAPTTTLQPMFNAWYPDWLTPADPPTGGTMVVDRYEYRARESR